MTWTTWKGLWDTCGTVHALTGPTPHHRSSNWTRGRPFDTCLTSSEVAILRARPWPMTPRRPLQLSVDMASRESEGGEGGRRGEGERVEGKRGEGERGGGERAGGERGPGGQGLRGASGFYSRYGAVLVVFLIGLISINAVLDTR
eukprot:1328973-Amorphochlora_amoeboformis.AAC.1